MASGCVVVGRIIFILFQIAAIILGTVALATPYWLEPSKNNTQFYVSSGGALSSAGMWQVCGWTANNGSVVNTTDTNVFVKGFNDVKDLFSGSSHCTTNNLDKAYSNIYGKDYWTYVQASAAMAIMFVFFGLIKLISGSCGGCGGKYDKSGYTCCTPASGIATAFGLLELICGIATLAIWGYMYANMADRASSQTGLSLEVKNVQVTWDTLKNASDYWGWSYFMFLGAVVLSLVDLFLVCIV